MPDLASVDHLIEKCFCYATLPNLAAHPAAFATCAYAFGQEHFRAFGLKKDAEAVCAESSVAQVIDNEGHPQWSRAEAAVLHWRFSRSCMDGVNVEMEARENAALTEERLCEDAGNETFQCLQFDLGDRPTSAIDLECTSTFSFPNSFPFSLTHPPLSLSLPQAKADS